MAVTGYRAIANSGADSHKEVPHYHLHLLGGQRTGTAAGACRLLTPREGEGR